MLRILDITAPDINNGNGIRVTLWVAGCLNHCKGCHNEWTWDFNQGTVFRENKEKIYEELAEWLDRDYVEGLTLSGGDPLTQDDDALREEIEIIEWFRKNYPEKNIWLYTGKVYEDLIKMPKFKFKDLRLRKKTIKHKKLVQDILQHIDVLVDGPYIESLRDVSHCPFRGSTNQRIIPMQIHVDGKTVM